MQQNRISLKQLFRALCVVGLLTSVFAVRSEAQVLPGVGDCAVCSYDFTDLNHIIPSCDGGREIGFVECSITGNYCTQSGGTCPAGGEEQNMDVALYGGLVVSLANNDEQLVSPTSPRASRYVAFITALGTVPCAAAARLQMVGDVGSSKPTSTTIVL